MRTALLLIDIQNDYFPGGLFPLWHTDETLRNIVAAIGKAEILKPFAAGLGILLRRGLRAAAVPAPPPAI